MTLKKILSCGLLCGVLLLTSATGMVSAEQTDTYGQCSVILDNENSVVTRVEYSMMQAAEEYKWIWAAYPDAWKIDYAVNSEGQKYCRVYMEKGDMNYTIVNCAFIDQDRCFVKVKQ